MSRLVKAVPLPRAKTVAYVRALFATEQLDLEEALRGVPEGDPPRQRQRASMAVQVAAYVCDAEGAPIYTQETARAALDAIYAVDMREILNEANKLNTISDDALEDTEKK